MKEILEEQSVVAKTVKKKTILNLDKVSKTYYTDEIETLALNNINLSIEKGAFVAIMGPSGCGKSTLLNVMGLLDKPTEGTIHIEEDNTVKLSDNKLSALRNKKIGFVFQSFHLINDLNVKENVEIPLLYRSGVSWRERRQRVKEAIEKVGLASRGKHLPTQLSGGQRQRVAIARALVGEPELILADEPTGNLDSKMGQEIMNLLHQLNEEGTTIVMVTHDEHLARQCDYVIRLFDGHRIE